MTTNINHSLGERYWISLHWINRIIMDHWSCFRTLKKIWVVRRVRRERRERHKRLYLSDP